ncbi:MAG TPA: hypothetical protein VGC21_07545 [Telluria sp.]
MDHADSLQNRDAEPDVAVPPALQHTDELPSWLAPGANPAPPSRLSNPAVAWGSTLAATALMVAFGVWLGDVAQTEPPAPLAATVPAPAPALPEPAPGADVPPMVLVEQPPKVAPVLSAPAPVKVRALPAARPVVSAPKRQLASAGTRSGTRARTRTFDASPVTQWRKPMVAAASKVGRPIRCNHGELARECLARYR